MARLTRRQFVGTSLGAAAAGVGVASGVTSIAGPLGATAVAGGAATAQRSNNATPMIVYVDRGGSGQLHLMVDDRQITVQDHEIVNRLVAATA